MVDKKKEQQAHANWLSYRAIQFTRKYPLRDGAKILRNEGSGQSAHQEMEYRKGDIYIKTSLYSHAQGNGSSRVTVEFKGQKVLEAGGICIGGPGEMVATTYIPGDWEKIIPEKGY